jgi:hypothetical protein
MAYPIRIEFTGLALWVPDGDKLYVLLPAHYHERHYQRLYRCRAPSPECKPDLNDAHNLEGFQLEVVSGSAGGATPQIPPGIVSIRDFAGRVQRRLLTDDDSQLAARIVLPGGKITVKNKGVLWRIGPRQPQFMTHNVIWSLDGGAVATLNKTPLAGGSPAPVDVKPTNEKLELQIYNVPCEDLPSGPDPIKTVICGDEPHHFVSYYDLLGVTGNQRRMPRFAGKDGNEICPEEGPGSHGGHGHHGHGGEKGRSPEAFVGGSPFTCMMATTDPKDP